MVNQNQGIHPAFEYVYKIYILCQKIGNNISTGSETIDVGWFDEDKLPELSLPLNNEKQTKMVFEFHRGERTDPHFD